MSVAREGHRDKESMHLEGPVEGHGFSRAKYGQKPRPRANAAQLPIASDHGLAVEPAPEIP